MGRSISTNKRVTISDVAYAVCNFGGAGGSYYRLLNKDFKPARSIPGAATVAGATAVANYSTYGAQTPSGFAAMIDPAFTLGVLAGSNGSTSNTIHFDGLLQQASGLGGANTPPATSNGARSNYTGRTGEFGHDHWNLDTNGAILLPLRSGTFGHETKTEASDSFVNADLKDRDLVMLLWQGSLYLVRRRQVEDVIVSGGAAGFISKFAVSGLPDGFYGSASYNRSRNELVIVGGSSATSATGMWMRLYRNLPEITHETDLAAVLSAVVPTQIAIAWSGWTPTANAEAVGGATPVLVDNGDVFVSFFNESAALHVVRFPRSGDAAFSAPVNAVSYGVTTSYGRNAARGSGMNVMQTRDGETVAAYSQYYHCGAGLGVISINKRSSSARVMYSDAETNAGRSLLHWGDSGFAVAMNNSSTYSAHSSGNVIGFDCAGQTGAVAPKQTNLPIPNGYNSGGVYCFFVEVFA